jgi:hypothetical protein
VVLQQIAHLRAQMDSRNKYLTKVCIDSRIFDLSAAVEKPLAIRPGVPEKLATAGTYDNAPGNTFGGRGGDGRGGE